MWELHGSTGAEQACLHAWEDKCDWKGMEMQHQCNSAQL